MRSLRRALAPCDRARLALALARRLAGDSAFWSARRIAVYLAADGEMDLGPLVARCHRIGKRVYAPVLHGARLWFLPLERGARMRANRFGIAEPALDPSRRCHPMYLDLVLAPLVAFTARGDRLGMGGGFYDQTFAAIRFASRAPRPRLVGVAYEFQRVDALPTERWDVPLDGVVTDRGLRWFDRRHAADAASPPRP